MKKKRMVEIFTTFPLPLRAVMRGGHWRRSLMAGQSNFPATDGPNVRIDGPARWTQRPEQRFTVSLIPLLHHAAECQPT
jgi:hypothetical protein